MYLITSDSIDLLCFYKNEIYGAFDFCEDNIIIIIYTSDHINIKPKIIMV